MLIEIIHEFAVSFYGVILIPMIVFSGFFYIIAFSGLFIRNRKKFL